MYTEVQTAWKIFFEYLRELPMEIVNFKNKKIYLLIKEQQESYENMLHL